MAKLVFKNNKYYLACDHADREIPKKAGFKWDTQYKLWVTEDKFKALNVYINGGSRDGALIQIEIDSSVKIQLDSYLLTHIHTGAKDNYFEDFTLVTEGLQEFQRVSAHLIAFGSDEKNWLLADEPRLGKTIQACAVLNEKLKRDGIIRVIVICPSTVKINWRNELNYWINKDCVKSIQIVKKKNNEYFSVATPLMQEIGGMPVLDVKIINYDLLSAANLNELRKFSADVLFIDEEHALKNRKAQRTQKILLAKDALFKSVNQTIALTGTPITKNPVDIWPICRALCPESIAPYLNYWDFVKQFCQVKDSPFGKEIVGSKNEAELKVRLRSTFMIRRTKQQVLPQLPKTQFQIITLEKNKETGKIIKKEQALPKDELELALKKHTVKADGHLATLRKELGLAKISQCVEFIKDQLESEEKIVVFAWHTDVIATLAHELREADIGTVIVTGGTSDEQRQKSVECFQTNKDCRVFIGNILAAGEGITLNKASRIIFVESSWLPKDIKQASSRCENMLEPNPVLVQLLVVEDSIDANVLTTVIERVKSINQII